MNKLFKKNTKQHLFSLIGCPNIGKSTFFNRITWRISNVGNLDRITTTTLSGSLRNDKNTIITDLPGLYKLNPSSKDEEVVLDWMFNDSKIEKIINVVGINSLERDLDLTIDLLETNLVKQIVINMIDENPNHKINEFQLSHLFKTPVILVSSKKNLNINNSIMNLINQNKIEWDFKFSYDEKIENFISQAELLLPNKKISKRFIIIQYLSNNLYVINYLKENCLYCDFEKLKNSCNIDQSFIDDIFKIKKDFKNKIFSLLNKPTTKNKFIQNRFDKFILNKYVSIIFFILVLAAIFYLTFGEYAGGWIQSMFVEKALGGLKEIIGNQMLTSGSSKWAISLVNEGLLGGIFTVIGFVPWILFLTLFMTILEQIGYLARVSISFDKTFERFGLSGRSIINLITGIGCNIPSILMSRNLHSKKERTVLIMIAPLISCSARIVVFGWLGNVIVSPNLNWLFVLSLVLFSGIISLFLGMLFSKIAFRKKTTFFMTEVPIWRTPDFRTIFKKVFFEIYEFIKRIVLIIFIANLIIWFLTYTGPIVGALDLNDEVFVNNNSWIYYISNYLRYLFIPAGIGHDWRLVASLVSAFPAKEIAASNLEILFNGTTGFANFVFSSANAAGILTSFILFLSFYTPCLATTILIKKEAGKKLMITHLVLAFFITYLMSMFGYVFINFFTFTIFAINNISILIIVFLSLTILLMLSLIVMMATRNYLVNKKNKQIVFFNKIIKNTKIIFPSISIILLFTCSILMAI